MNRSTLLAALILLPALASAETENAWKMEPFQPNARNMPSLQHGAALFVNYCLGCHTLRFQRYERTADDLGIPHDIFMANLVFTDQKIGALITNALPQQASQSWFGSAPPDLTLVARLRGAEWVYNYLKAFYVDPGRPFGVNNKVFPNVGMPHALLELQGIPIDKSCRNVPKRAENGGEMRDPLLPGVAITEERCDFIDVVPGSGRLTAKEYDDAVYDIANFLHYVGEPTRADRERLGVYVLLFLVVLYVFTLLLGREYNKEVH